jgi:hypothetical protein
MHSMKVGPTASQRIRPRCRYRDGRTKAVRLLICELMKGRENEEKSARCYFRRRSPRARVDDDSTRAKLSSLRVTVRHRSNGLHRELPTTRFRNYRFPHGVFVLLLPSERQLPPDLHRPADFAGAAAATAADTNLTVAAVNLLRRRSAPRGGCDTVRLSDPLSTHSLGPVRNHGAILLTGCRKAEPYGADGRRMGGVALDRVHHGRSTAVRLLRASQNCDGG